VHSISAALTAQSAYDLRVAEISNAKRIAREVSPDRIGGKAKLKEQERQAASARGGPSNKNSPNEKGTGPTHRWPTLKR
jgi:hypothetical protein